MNKTTNRPEDLLDERDVERLLESAGPRPDVPEAQMAAIRAAAREDWRRSVEGPGRHDTRRWATPVALAATLLLALSVAWWWRSFQSVEGRVVANVERAGGMVYVSNAAARVGQALPGGSELATGSASADSPVRFAIRLAGGQSVRLDAESRLRLESESVLTLERGAVYVDSGPGSGSLEIRTPLGSVRNVGTQFEVRLGSNGEARKLWVRVREGAVELEREGEAQGASAGEELRVSADGSLSRHELEARAPEWNWAVAAAPALEIQGLTLDAYLTWLVRETGWRIEWANDDLAVEAGPTELGGSFGDLTPEETVEAVLPGTLLTHRVEDGVLYIDR